MKRRFLALFAVWAIFAFTSIGAVQGAVAVPEKFKDVPLFADSKVEQAMDMGTAAMITATAKAKAEAVIEFYASAMKGKGWKVIFQLQNEDAQMMHFQKDSDVLHLNVQAADQGEGVTYTLVLSPK
ncbi:MAG: hypothetical protein ABFD97_06980 [Syntrophobacter sp.]